MNRVRQNERDSKTVLIEKLLGSTVLTSYNNKTYRIDDFQLDLSPQMESAKSPFISVDKKQNISAFIYTFQLLYLNHL